MATVKKCSNCEVTVDVDGRIDAGVGNIVPSMLIDENGMGPDVKECYKRGICPICRETTLN